MSYFYSHVAFSFDVMPKKIKHIVLEIYVGLDGNTVIPPCTSRVSSEPLQHLVCPQCSVGQSGILVVFSRPVVTSFHWFGFDRK